MDGALILGTGAVSGYGEGCEALYQGIFTGNRSLRTVDRLQHVECLCSHAAEVPRAITDSCKPDDLPLLFATLAAREAMGQCSSDPNTALVLATTKACMHGIGSEAKVPAHAGLAQPAGLAQALAEQLSWQGPVHAISAACASGLAAMALAGRAIATGQIKRALVVGTDALSPFVLRGFSALLALDPGLCRPFDRDRRGLSLGEGAGAILLGRLDGSAGSADDSMQLTGWGESNDANHITGPSRDGRGLAQAIEKALKRAQLPASAIDFVHLHGTGTPYNDAMEQRALSLVFDPVPPCAGSKAQLGHTLGAAGVLESIITLESLRRGMTPPNIGYSQADVRAPFELSADPSPLSVPRQALKIAAGFGGINAALTFEYQR